MRHSVADQGGSQNLGGVKNRVYMTLLYATMFFGLALFLSWVGGFEAEDSRIRTRKRISQEELVEILAEMASENFAKGKDEQKKLAQSTVEKFVILIANNPSSPLSTYLFSKGLENRLFWKDDNIEPLLDAMKEMQREVDGRDLEVLNLLIARAYAAKSGTQRSRNRAIKIYEESWGKRSGEYRNICIWGLYYAKALHGEDVESFLERLKQRVTEDPGFGLQAEYMRQFLRIRSSESMGKDWIEAHFAIFNAALEVNITDLRYEEDPWPMFCAGIVAFYLSPYSRKTQALERLMPMLNDKNDPPWAGRLSRVYLYQTLGQEYFFNEQYAKAKRALEEGRKWAKPEQYYLFDPQLEIIAEKADEAK